MKSVKIFKSTFLVLLFLLTLTFIGCGQPDEITVEETDNLKLELAYEGKSFINEGIGKVVLTQTVDGDTAHFRDIKTGQTFTARFLMINTPESTGKIDPWGKKASEFTSSKLKNAVEIVLESEVHDSPAEKDTTGKRYLAFVWYRPAEGADLRLLNLEIVEECYSRFTGVKEDSEKYGELFDKVNERCFKLGTRVYGEQDPDFDYSYEVTPLTIAYLREHFDEYTNGSKIEVVVRVVRKNGNNVYVEDVNQTEIGNTGEYNTAGIYVYSGFGVGAALGRSKIGAVYSFQCQVVDNETYGHQLTNPLNITTVEGASEVDFREFDGNTNIDLESLEGYVIKVNNVTVQEIGDTKEETGAYTITVSTQSGQRFNIRIDGATTPKFDYRNLEVGQVRNIIGGVSKYNESFQVMLCNQKDEGLHDFDLSE